MRFQTNDSLCTDYCIMYGTGRQVESIASFQCEFLSEFGQSESDTSLHNVDHFVVRVLVRRVNVVRTIGPRVGTESFCGHESLECRSGWGDGIRPRRNKRRAHTFSINSIRLPNGSKTCARL